MSVIEVDIGKGLRALGALTIHEFDVAEDQIAELLAEEWRRKVFEIEGGPKNKIAYETGAYLDSIRVVQDVLEAGDERIRDVLSDVGYADIIERGRKPPVTYPGRYIAEAALEAVEDHIPGELASAVRRIEELLNGVL